MTPELKEAIEAVLAQALDMGNSYQVPSQTMYELMEAFDAEPTEKDKKTNLIEDPTTDETASQMQQFYDFAESNQRFAIRMLWRVYEAAYESTNNYQKSMQAAELFAKDGFDLKRSSLERLLKLFGEMMETEGKRIANEFGFNSLKEYIENENRLI